ncbi:glutamate racemase [Dietzia sp.]|uniref:glutamate racemase n=1 Tax=Dietzia sp. TaxID=1871616 RepID=UPI002FD95502
MSTSAVTSDSGPEPSAGRTDNSAPIGIFDSGVGGLTVARSVMDQLPGEGIVYVGDTANGPYGPLPLAEARRHSVAVADALVERGVKALVIACNTATAASLDVLRERYEVPVVEVITPAVRRAVATTRSGRIGVIGTQGTVASGAYQRAFAERGVDATAVACPRFVDFVERGITSGRQILGLAEAYLAPLRAADSDTVVLGCTHYPLLSGVIQLSLGPEVSLVSSAEETAKDLLAVLTEKGALAEPASLSAEGEEQVPVIREFLSTGDPYRFTNLAKRFLGPGVGRAGHLDVG